MAQGWLQIALFLVVADRAARRCSAATWRASTRASACSSRPVLGPVERLIYRLLRVDPSVGQDWKGYARSVLVFSGLFWLALYLILRTQTHPSVQPARASTPAPGT